MAATVRPNGKDFEADAPKALFQGRFRAASARDTWHTYSVSPDGQQFLMITAVEDRTSVPITVVVNWIAGLKK